MFLLIHRVRNGLYPIFPYSFLCSYHYEIKNLFRSLYSSPFSINLPLASSMQRSRLEEDLLLDAAWTHRHNFMRTIWGALISSADVSAVRGGLWAEEREWGYWWEGQRYCFLYGRKRREVRGETERMQRGNTLIFISLHFWRMHISQKKWEEWKKINILFTGYLTITRYHTLINHVKGGTQKQEEPNSVLTL